MENSTLENHFKMKLDLNDQELIEVEEFLKTAQSLSLEIYDMDIAVKFLRAKKFNVNAAIDLYTKHQAVRVKENLNEINPFQSDVLNELLSKKFTFLLNCDRASGASVCIFTVKLHMPSKSSHENVLKALIFQLDAALTTPSVQQNGIIFVYDMNGSLYSNFDIQLSVKILNLLKGAYPARLCKVIIFTPPLWFRASFNFLRLFVREKLRERIFIVTKDEELHRYITRDVLPTDLGGLVDHSHKKWLCKAFVSMGYSEQTLQQYMTSHEVDAQVNTLKLQESNHSSSSNTKFYQNHFNNQNSSDFDDDLLSSVLPGILHEKSTTSSSSGVASLDYTVSPTTMLVNNDDNCHESSPDDSSSSGQDCCGVSGTVIRDNTSSDYELISISSWDLNLSVSGDENALESDDGDCPLGRQVSTSEASTVENSPNIVCCSAKTPIRSLETSLFFRKLSVKRRNNAERLDCKLSVMRQPSWALGRPDSEKCLHGIISPDNFGDDSERGVTIEYFVESVDHSVFATMNEFRSDSIYGNIPQFNSYSHPMNAVKNRYSDIPCIEDSRVRLSRDTVSSYQSENYQFISQLKPNDYIHANWVDGYRQKNAFICTQGPLSTTVSDFWHMIIQYRVPIIVMTTRPREQNRDKCYQYWPDMEGETKIISGINDNYDSYEVTSLRSKEFGPRCPKTGVCDPYNEHWYRVALLHVKNLKTGQEHRVNHFYFHSWPDQGIPHSSEGFLHFILQIRQTYRLNIAKLGYDSEMDQEVPPPPIVVHCSAGIGRTGTYIVTEICSKSLSDCGRFNLHQTMLKVRSQRYKCVQNSYQYLYCRNTIIDYAKQFGLLDCHDNDNNVDEEEEEEEVEEEEEEEFNEPIEEASDSD